MSFKVRNSKMSRNLSRHSGVSCDACGKGSFSGKRYKCLVCYDFDLCADCYEARETGTSKHSVQHPMQCILTRIESDLFFGGESPHIVEQPQSFTCPMCGQLGFSETQLREHVTKHHSDGATLQEVICPVCASHPSGDPNHLTDDLATHLTMEHRALRDMEQDPNVVQSRVRRLIGRRRPGHGLDRYAGVIAREPQDSSDPITELLSQLSGGMGAGNRRPVPEVPAHIQQILEHQERQALERGSPLRRPVYRKVITSGNGESGGLTTEGTAATYLIPGTPSSLIFPPHSVKDDMVDMPQGLLVSEGKEDVQIKKTALSDSNYLLPFYDLPKVSDEEQERKEGRAADRSLFVQELLLSSIVCSDSSCSDTSDKDDVL